MNFFQHALKFFIVICFAFVSIGPKMVCAEDQLQQQLQNLQIVAEENFPPISFLNKDGKPDGLAVEIVEEIMKRLKIKQKIVVWPWVRAYRKTVKGPNFVLFSIARTAEREPLFQWTSSIFQMKSSFYAKKDSGLKINSLDDAKKLNIIGSYRDCFEEQFLKKEGFKNLSLVTNNILNVKN